MRSSIIRHRRALGAAVTVVLLLTACGSDSSTDTSPDSSPDTYESYFQSFILDFEPARSLDELKQASDVAVRATLQDVEDGRVFGTSETDPEASRSLNLVFAGPTGELYYVGIPRPADSSIDQLRSVLPIGSESIVYLRRNTDPIDEFTFNTRADGNEWFFTTPQGWVLDHPTNGIEQPLVGVDDQTLGDAPGPTADLASWLPGPAKTAVVE